MNTLPSAVVICNSENKDSYLTYFQLHQCFICEGGYESILTSLSIGNVPKFDNKLTTSLDVDTEVMHMSSPFLLPVFASRSTWTTFILHFFTLID